MSVICLSLSVRRFCSAIVATAALCACSPAPAATIKIAPANTFLRVNNETPPNSVPIVLAHLGIAPGDVILIQRLGDFRPGSIHSDTSVSMIAVFCSSVTLLASTEWHRVVDAIDAGADITMSKTCHGSVDTDIPEDFLVTDGAIVKVPAGATHLFVCPPDSLFYDNTDPDNDYAVAVTRIVPGDLIVSALGIWGGLLKASPTSALYLDAVPSPAPPPVVDMCDAVRLARRASGLDP